MTKFPAKKLIYLILAILLVENLSAEEKILPKTRPENVVELKEAIISPKIKPRIDKNTYEEIIKSKLTLPIKKPSIKIQESIETVEKKKATIEKAETSKKEVSSKSTLPMKKPVVYQKKIEKVAKKSQYFSKSDFRLAKNIFSNVKKRKWNRALNSSKKVKNKSIYKLVKWLYLLEPNNQADFYDYINFINLNSNFPRLGRLRYLAEHKINTKIVAEKRIINFFSEEKPFSGYGKLMLGHSYITQGNYEKGVPLLKDGWVTAKLSKNDLRYFIKKFKKHLGKEDHIKRADWLAWENKYWDLKRILRYLPKDYQALYNARQLLMSKSYGVDLAISKIPNKFKKDAGLQYERLKWRRKRGRIESSLEILMEIKNDPKYLIRPRKWWYEREIISRSLVYKKKYAAAYKVSSTHSMIDGPEYAEAEWMSGWIALSFLDDPILATQHFHNFYNNVGYPISLSRGAYWLGKAYKKLNKIAESKKWYIEASKYLTTYYGQLAFIEINGGINFSLNEQSQTSKEFENKFKNFELYKLVILLYELNKTDYSKNIIKHLAQLNVEKGSEILAGNLATSIGRYDYAIQIAKRASYEKRFHNYLNYPVINTPLNINNKRMPSGDLILAIIRQESEFDPKANSSVGAKGMMQLMTYTAKLVAKQAKLPYSKKRLTSDPNYNISLGSYYFAGLLEIYEGSYPFSIAAYNAGPNRVKHWRKVNGDPQKGKINYIDWIELIKFRETRNYVQRVLENVNVYKFMLSKKPITIHNFFVDKPHY